MRRFRRWYGSSPLHLLALAASFALAWYAGTRMLDQEALLVVVWFVGAAVVHDLVLFPLYTAADRTAQTALASGAEPDPTPAYLNYLRFPAFISALLLLVWLPLILNLVDGYAVTTALDESVFLPRWALITAGLFTLSALVLATRLLLRAHRHRPRRHKRRAATKRQSGPE
ncbi:hypothetical protein [Kitasatospora sp. KL5]|uniref:hypothetical protein n=1 Tax=Kitasatospora sp. KL5 TaxID=3425125 RepID=UPI003D6F6822